jgi:hypothetical protein
MRVLDIDLDVFVTPINAIHSNSRLADDHYHLMPPIEIDDFLLDKCGLSAESPKPGAVFEEHDQMFDTIRDLVETNRLVAPFELFHVDAHADLGASQLEPFKYLITELMHQSITERTKPNRGNGGLNRGTVLMFAAACEWISKLVYICHPDDGDDLPTLLLDFDDEGEPQSLRMPSCSLVDFQKQWEALQITLNGEAFWDNLKDICDFGGRIPFERKSISVCGKLPDFDFVFLTRSPGFTPPKADAVFDRIRSLIRPYGEFCGRI